MCAENLNALPTRPTPMDGVAVTANFPVGKGWFMAVLSAYGPVWPLSSARRRRLAYPRRCAVVAAAGSAGGANGSDGPAERATTAPIGPKIATHPGERCPLTMAQGP
ncbi:hypothetical protein GCM10010339_20170 [Streptomyces alanosinicus]|uniref:Uncharacterized protein n=1 Tax=Streptomyces alanosinicus TaxID=68171 RepID=A0A918YF82_9ACTN|nr:hypothetical protein GCM10010339_20170 [Streptomyces alanosinicus]